MVDLSFWRFGALVASLVPGALIFLMLLRIGRRRLSPNLLTVAVASGAMIAFLPLTFSLLEPVAREAFDGAGFFFVRAFVFAGLSEEGGKLLACCFIVMPHFRRRGRADLILACAGVGLGFALIENVSYVLRASDQWKSIALTRAISSVPMHAFLGLIMGLGLARAETNASRRTGAILGAWLACAALHGLYDLPMFLGEILPLSIPLVNVLAGLLSVSAPTLLAASYLLAVIATICVALRSVSICRRDLGVESESDRPWLARLSPVLLDRLVFSATTGLLFGALLTLAGLALIAVGFIARASGAEPMQPLIGAALGAFVVALGWGVAGDEFAALFRDRASLARSLAAFASRRRLAAGVIGVAVVVAVAGGGYWGVLGFRHAVASTLVASGMWRAAIGSLDLAIANFDAAFGYVPDLLVAYQARAETYRIMQDYDRALADLDRAVELYPNDASAHAMRALIYAVRHDYTRALPALDQALTLDPGNVSLLAARGGARLDSGDLEGATQDAERALRARPDLSTAYDLDARILVEKDDAAGAVVRYGEAIRIDPKNAEAYFSRGRLYFEKQDYRAASEDFWRAALIGGGHRSYIALWLYLARANSGQDGRPELATWSKAIARDVWPYPLIELYLGSKPLASVASAATTNDQRCEFAFYVGELAILAKMETDGARLLSGARDLCPRDFIEARASRKELARVEAKLAVARIDAPAVEAKAPEPARAPASAPIGDPAHALHKADWRAIAPGGARGAHGALEIRSIELPGGLIGVLSLYASSEPAPGAEFAIQFACRVVGQRGSMNFQSVDLSVAGARLPAISLGIGAYGLFHARLSKAEAESFVQTLRDASALRLVAYGDSFEKIGLPRRETDVEIEDAARTAIRAFALSLSSTTVAHPPPVDAQRKPLAKRGR